MNILVTGASGYIGSALIPELAEAGHSGVAVSRKPMSKLPPDWLWRNRAAVLEVSSQARVIPQAVDAVIHLEVKQHVYDPTRSDLAEFEAVNVEGVKHWLDWCDSHRVSRFILFSSIKAVADSEECRDENADGEPATAYGMSKARGESLVRKWAQASHGRAALVLRLAVVYGPGNEANMFSLVEAIDRGRFFLIGRNDNVKSLVAMRNLLAAVTHLIERMQPGLQIYNITDRHSYSVCQLAVMIAKVLGRDGTLRTLPLPFAQALAFFGDAVVRITGIRFPLTRSRLKALLESTHFSCEKLIKTGFRHPQTTEQGLSEMIKWYRNSKPGSERS